MTSRYRNDYIRGITQTGMVSQQPNNLLVNKTAEESRARFSNIMNSLSQRHEEEKETYTPPTIQRETVIRDIPRKIQLEPYEPLDREEIRFTPKEEMKKDNTLITIVVVIIIGILLVIAYKLYISQKLIDTLIQEEAFRSHRF